MPTVMPGLSSSRRTGPGAKLPRRKQALHVGGGGFLQHLDRRADERRGVGQHAGTVDQVAHDLAGKGQAAGLFVERLGADHGTGDPRDVVVLEIPADPRQCVGYRNADAGEMVGVADARQLQHMRRTDRTRRQDHLAGRVDALDCARRTVAGEFDSDRALAVEQHAMHQRAGHDLQIGPFQRGPQIGPRRALPPATAPGLLDPADIVAGTRRQMVDVLVIGKTDLFPGLDHDLA